MKRRLIAVLCAGPMLCTMAEAEDNTSIGLGFGPLYSGLGINIGLAMGTSLKYVAAGCLSGSISSGSDTSVSSNGSATTTSTDDSYNTNCGIGVGWITSALLPGNRQGLGLALGASYDTDEGNSTGGGAEWHFAPTYNFFFNGIDRRGFNLGAGPGWTFRDGKTGGTDLRLNVGFQF